MYVWSNPSSVKQNSFINEFERRVKYSFLQNWFTKKENSGTLELYNYIKLNFEYESYLDIVPCSLRVYLSRIRLSSHPLRI